MTLITNDEVRTRILEAVSINIKILLGDRLLFAETYAAKLCIAQYDYTTATLPLLKTNEWKVKRKIRIVRSLKMDQKYTTNFSSFRIAHINHTRAEGREFDTPECRVILVMPSRKAFYKNSQEIWSYYFNSLVITITNKNQQIDQREVLVTKVRRRRFILFNYNLTFNDIAVSWLALFSNSKTRNFFSHLPVHFRNSAPQFLTVIRGQTISAVVRSGSSLLVSTVWRKVITWIQNIIQTYSELFEWFNE